jgi:hypothetical protein
MRTQSPSRSTVRAAVFGVIVFGSTCLGVASCSSNDSSNPAPPVNSFTTSSSTGNGGATSSASTSTSTAPSGGGGGTTATTASASSGSGGGSGGAGGQPACALTSDAGPVGCYACAPKTEPQFLNQCTGSQCSHYDNVANLPLYNGGNLPALP